MHLLSFAVIAVSCLNQYRLKLSELSHFDILGKELRLLDKAALFEDHLMDLKLSHIVDRTHSIINLVLALFPE